MIPHDRPFRGQDLDDFRQRFGLTVDEMCYFCGVTRNRWFMMVMQERELPLRDVPIALTCRLIDQDESLYFMPKFTSPQELWAKLEGENSKITLREFSVLMGNNGTSANRWTRARKRATPTVYRLATVVTKLIEKRGIEKALSKARDITVTEAVNRKILNIFSEGRWTITDKDIAAARVPSKKYGKQKEIAKAKA